jgi:urease accessory protein
MEMADGRFLILSLSKDAMPSIQQHLSEPEPDMLRALGIEARGHWPSDAAHGTVTLGYDDRHRRRVQLTSDAGEPFLLDLPRTGVLEEGDGLALSDGRWLMVKAKPEALVEITAPDGALLARVAWHLGNRHLPAQIEPTRILIRDDHVIAAMLEGLGARLRRIEAPFTPERGAYDAAPHRHDHDH